MKNARNRYILKGTEDFVRGEMDNVTLVENALCLEQMAGRYVLYGCYTSKAASLPAFTQLAMSWNAETPRGTVVEAQCRVLVGENWSSWLSFGKWSPFIERTHPEPDKNQPVYIENGILKVAEGRATQAQLRIYLYTDNERISPLVRLLGVSVRPADWQKEPANPYGRLIRLPAYSREVRDPALREQLDSPCALASLMNRWGQDVLPEELAYSMADFKTRDCSDLSFAVANAGAWGYEARLAYLDPLSVWEHIKAGESVALELCYSTTGEGGTNLLTGSFSDGERQLVPLRGFELTHEGKVMALVNNCHAPTDREAEKSYAAEELWEAYTGLALLMSGFHKNQVNGAPLRRHMSLRALTEVGCYLFQDSEGEDQLLEEDFKGTLAATLRDGSTWATTAHKSFHYLEPGPNGSIRIPQELLEPGGKITLYAIWPDGKTLVGEINL